MSETQDANSVSNANQDSKMEDQSVKDMNTTGLQEAAPGQGSKLVPEALTAAQTAEAKKIGAFPSDLSNIKPIFCLKSKNTQAKERFSQKPQEYLDSHKMSIYLQDAIKIILDRREEKPLDLLTD